MRRIAVLTALLLAGCTTVGPEYRAPSVPVPQRFAEAHAQNGLNDAELALWWKRFRDPVLDDLVNRALAQNLDVEAAAARIREARAREIVAGAATGPELSADASATRQRISENAIPVPPSGGNGRAFGLPGSEFTTFRVGFDASWELDLFGRNRRAAEAARARASASLWSRRDVQVGVAAEVARTYFDLRTARQRYENAESEYARRMRVERLAAARAAGGLINSEETRRLESERLAGFATLAALRAEIETRTHALGVLVGLGPDAFASGLYLPPATSPEHMEIPAGLPSDLLRRRPDIRAAERELAAATADVGVAVADLYPHFSLTAAPALISTALDSLLERASRSYSAGAGLVWPLLDGGRARGNVAVANARSDQALIAYRKAVLTALQDVEDSLSRIQGDREQLMQLESAVSAATAAERLADSRYRGGLVTYADVLLARGRRLQLESQMIEMRGALARDTVALFKALGGGWPELAEAGAQP